MMARVLRDLRLLLFVLNHLVVGVAVDGGDVTLLNAEAVVQNFGHGSQAVGGAGSVADTFHIVGEFVVVHADHDGGIDGILRRSREDDLLGTILQVVAIAALAAFLGAEHAGGFNHHIGSLAPLDVQR